jgi:hypothetical protein
MKKSYSLALLCCAILCSLSSVAQTVFFTDISENAIKKGSNTKRVIIPEHFRTVTLRTADLRSFLWSLPTEKEVAGRRNQAPVLELPGPDGKPSRFHVWESSIMEPALAARFSEMKTFAGQGIDDPYATIRLDYNPYFGFHAQVLSAASGNYYIDPYARGNIENYISYYTRDNNRNPERNCETVAEPAAFRGGITPDVVPVGNCRGTQLYTYRLALACTGEYAAAVCAPSLPTIPATAAAMLTSVNRVDGVYEVETSIRMVLVANNANLIYLDGTTDPYTNNSGTTMLGQNQANIDAVIGTPNYDIGHVVSTGGGGVASLRSPCKATSKARGVTGLTNPVGDNFDIDYVAHEMGHQWGGNHTFNGSTPGNCGGNRNGGTAYEVGSGTTIQGYAGICGVENTQPHSDPYFLAVSFDVISVYVEDAAGGAACRVVSPTGNTLPQITAMNDNGVTIPINTPFTLSAAATDINGDAITYNWEEWDLGAATVWNQGNVNTSSPLFKSRIPKTNGSRTFPDMAVILANYPVNPPSVMGGLKGETLPTQARTMKFRLTVRDNRAGGGGIVTGGDGCQTGFTTPFQVNISGTTPFAVTVPNGGESYQALTTQAVTWDAAATNAAPFNTTSVRILLSTDNGLTYPTVLLASTDNDGSENVVYPNTPTTTARIKIEAIGNIFFDISNAPFTITAPPVGFSFNATTATTIGCAGPTSATVSLGTTSTGGFNTPINLTATSVPAGTTVSFGPNPVTPGSATVVTLNNTQLLAAGTYTIGVTGVAGTSTLNTTVSFMVSPGTAPTIATQTANTAVCSGGNAVFTVATSGAAVTGYQWQNSPDGVTFTNIAGATAATYSATAVATSFNNYRFRVIVSGQCGSVTSSAAILTVQTAPVITAQPQNAVECVGNNAVFTATASGSNLTYQWEFSTDGVAPYSPIAGAVANTYTVTGVTLAQNNYRYRVVVSGTCSPAVTSNAAILSVGNAAAITTQPSNLAVCSGQNASFSVSATGSSLTYQWQLSTNAGGTWTNISGQTTATLNLTAVTAGMTGYQYRLNIFSCTATPVTSNAVTLTVNIPAGINTQPVSVVLCETANAAFSVAAVGTGLSYQWQVSTTGCAGTFTNITGANTNSLAVNAVTASQNGYAYRVVVTGTCNSVTSGCATLTVNNPIIITTQPASTSACLPTQTTASFSLAVTGTAPTYQWQLSTNGGTSWTNIAGATTNTLSLTGLTASMTGYQYRVVLNGTCTSNLNSNAATLTVNTLVEILTQPVDRRTCTSEGTSFSVTASGSTITYQWQASFNGGAFVNIINEGPYTGVNTATLNITNAGLNLSGNRYRVIVSGVPCGSVTSASAGLTVFPLPVVVLFTGQYPNITPYINTALYTAVSPPGNYTYQWFRNGALVPGASTSVLPVNVDGFGEYRVVVSDANGCSNTSNRVSISDSVSNELFVYPNPSSGQFVVRYYSSVNTTTSFTLSVYDSKGTRVYSRLYPIVRPYDRMDVNLGNVSSGTYFVDLRDATGKRLGSSTVIIR